MMVADGIITIEQLNEALEIQKGQLDKPGSEVKRVGVILQNLGYLDKETLEKYINKVILANF